VSEFESESDNRNCQESESESQSDDRTSDSTALAGGDNYVSRVKKGAMKQRQTANCWICWWQTFGIS